VRGESHSLVSDFGDRVSGQYCHRKPKLKNYPHCGAQCRDNARVACLICRSRPKNGKYHFCGRTCKDIAMKITPLLVEARPGHVTFEMGKLSKLPPLAITMTVFSCPYDIYAELILSYPQSRPSSRKHGKHPHRVLRSRRFTRLWKAPPSSAHTTHIGMFSKRVRFLDSQFIWQEQAR
jgi:hypothetical protein